MERRQPGVDLGWRQSEASLLGGIDGLTECEPVVGEGGMEIADVGQGPFHGAQEEEVGKNTVVNGGHMAEETRPRWCVSIWLVVVDRTLPTWARSGHSGTAQQSMSIRYVVVGDQN
jgi:hypothetical protein